MYLITEKEVIENFDMKTAIDAMKDAFTEYYKGTAGADSRVRTYSGSSVLSTMPAYMNRYGISGMKTYIAGKSGAKFFVLLFDTNSNELIALIEANRLGQVRTGAVTALATSLLRPEIRNVVLVGSGFQAETQLEGILSISNPEEIRVYSRTLDHCKKFAENMEKKYGRDVRPFEDIRSAMSGADTILSITSSTAPVITDLSFLEEYHLNLAGANVLTRREADEQVIEDADLVVTEHLDQSYKESSEITDFINSGGRVIELKDVVGNKGKFSGKKTIFKSMGIGLEDISSAYYLLKKMQLI